MGSVCATHITRVKDDTENADRMGSIRYNSKYRFVWVSDLEGEYDTLMQPGLIRVLDKLYAL